MADTHQPVTLGIVGIGGYAANVCDLVLNHGPTCDPSVRLAGVSDPALDDHGQRVEQLRGQSVALHTDLQPLLDNEAIDAIWLPLPIPLHRQFTERVFAAGKAVMCEKPLAGAVQDVDAMIGARDKADGGRGLPGAVGFQHIYAPETLRLKRRLMNKEWGRMQSVTVRAYAPRTDEYFQRNQWAGAMSRDGLWVLDSPANNACSHFINLALFLLGPSEHESAQPTAVEAELYRTRDIDNYETICMRLTLGTGPSVLVYMTHACAQSLPGTLHFKGEHGSVRYAHTSKTAREGEGQGNGNGQGLETIIPADTRPAMLNRLARLIRGLDDPHHAYSSFESARQHTLAINGASQATAIVDVPQSSIEPKPGPKGGTVRTIPGIEHAFDQCAHRDMLLHESGLVDFSQTAGRLNLAGYNFFDGPAVETGLSS